MKTPPPEIVAELPYNLGLIFRFPVNHNYCIVELGDLPENIGFPKQSPRIYSVVGLERSGMHAHKIGSEKEIMICLHGTASIHLMNQQGNYCEVILSREEFHYPVMIYDNDSNPPIQVDGITEDNKKWFYGLYIPEMIWHTAMYRPLTVLQVIASVSYDSEFYIFNPEKYFNSGSAIAKFRGEFPIP